MSQGSFDIADPVLDVRAEVVDLVVTLVDNVGPPGVPGDVGPMDPGLPDHVLSESPHPVYDDGPSLTLLYENAKV